MTEKIIKKLNGYSGCNLFLLHSDTKGNYVRKYSSDPSYNHRLKEQCRKQTEFFSQNNHFVKTPRVLNTGEKENLFFFDMEFIPARTFSEALVGLTPKHIFTILDLLLASPGRNINEMEKESILKKISTLEVQLKENPVALSALEMVRDLEMDSLETSFCHGDLTTENILINSKGEIILIDFLDSFYNSWMMDAAKLLQDFVVGWSFRRKKNLMSKNFEIKLSCCSSYIDYLVMQKVGRGDAIINVYRLLLMNLLRIYPYSRDNCTKNFLDDSVKNVMNLISIK